MDKDKQIEEMAVENLVAFLWHNTAMYDEDLIFDVAEALVNAGYRKASEVAEEIDDLRRYIILNENIAKKCKSNCTGHEEEYWRGKLSAFLQIRGYLDTELKKKYTEDGECGANN